MFNFHNRLSPNKTKQKTKHVKIQGDDEINQQQEMVNKTISNGKEQQQEAIVKNNNTTLWKHTTMKH